MIMKPDIWMDGEFVPWDKAFIHPLSHSLQRGATLFESIDCVEAANGHAAVLRLSDHLIRFEDSSRLTVIPLPYNVEELEKAVIATVARSGMHECTIRPLAFYTNIVFDIYPGDSKVSVVIGLGERHEYIDSIKMKISRMRKIDNASMPIKAKVSGNYISPMIAKSEAIKEGFDDAIILDSDGFVAEGSTSNIFIVENGMCITSPDSKIMEGITRNTVMILSEKLGINIIKEQFSPERLTSAGEVFMCSSGMGVTPVTQVDNMKIGSGKPGKITMRLRSHYIDVTTGKVPEFSNWLTYI